ncbi:MULTISPECIES: alpha-L-rhamnosidase-related protein [unclassified Klebsiella]|uniref:alpha-L-rhamnosidase-related protein n=1 Tax=unclassified Klebsiella TaxID=2608929 RepID=UPI0018D6CCB5|nr:MULTISPECIES: amylo-alpha-1,6-glucosidase [unclassified Klebsiella]
MMTFNAKARWIWFAGDFEIRHALLQNLQREERRFDWPAYWHVQDCCKSVFFSRQYCFEQAESFYVQAEGSGYVAIGDKKYPLRTHLSCPPGKQTIHVYLSNATGLPSIRVEGEHIFSDGSWQASDYIVSAPAGWDELYQHPETSPNSVNYQSERREPVSCVAINGGVLFDFVHVVNGTLTVTFNHPNPSPIKLCYGESQAEALDINNCYYWQDNVTAGCAIRKRAFRYIFVPDVVFDAVKIVAWHEFIPRDNIASLCCDDPLIEQIWQVSHETFALCSDLFFIDGVKRDRWIWSGDAWQCTLINPYLFFDEAINRRTLLALRGRDPIRQHMNTIVDYSLLWISNVENHYLMSNDVTFIRQVFPQMVSLMEWLQRDIDEQGFIRGKEGDWIFIDWAEIDKTGAVCAEQMLLLKAWHTMALCAKLADANPEPYLKRANELAKNIDAFFWDEAQGAYIDSYESGRNNVTRHANIFALMFDLVSPKRRDIIVERVLLNDAIAQIVTPWFTFFELDTLCRCGQQERVLQKIRSYWGGMLALGATTFWEEYNPQVAGDEHYAMYGDKFGKSLCHAWGASPLYLLGRYFVGLRALTPGYETFIIEPWLTSFSRLDCTLPIKDGEVRLNLCDNVLTVCSTRSGGVVRLDGETRSLTANQPLTFSLK